MASKPVQLEDLGSMTEADVFDSTSQGLYYEAINQALGALLFSEAEKMRGDLAHDACKLSPECPNQLATLASQEPRDENSTN